jgi:hypothetical protein
MVAATPTAARGRGASAASPTRRGGAWLGGAAACGARLQQSRGLRMAPGGGVLGGDACGVHSGAR